MRKDFFLKPNLSTKVIVICVLTALFLAPHLNKPFHIDDVTFIWSAQHTINSDWTRPFAARQNWYGQSEPLWTHINHPPLNSYFLATLVAVFGEQEIPVHAGYMLPAILFIVGTFHLTQLLGGSGLLASVIALVTPVFWVSATTIMADVWMAAFWIWAVVFWIIGLNSGKNYFLFIASVAAGACMLTKFHGIALVPLLLVYSCCYKRSLPRQLTFLLIPVAIFILYQCVAANLYGRVPVFDAARYATGSQGDRDPFTRGLLTLFFVGGGYAPLAFLGPLLWTRRICIIWGLFFLAILITARALLNNTLGVYPIPQDPGLNWLWMFHFAVFLTAGIHVLTVVILHLWSNRNANGVLLVLWTIGIIVFTGFVNWTVNCRSLVLIITPVAVIAVLRIRTRGSVNPERPILRLGLPLLASAAISFVVAAADRSFAESARDAARSLSERYSEVTGTLWFQGHWGFQYYMELLGHKPFDMKNSRLIPGDRMVIPETNYGRFLFAPTHVKTIDHVEINGGLPAATMSMETGAGFYFDRLGPFPFTLGSVPVYRYEVLEVTQKMVFR